MVAILQGRVSTLMNENMGLNKRLQALEGKMQAMYAHFVKSPERSRIEFPGENVIRDKYVNMNQSLGEQGHVDTDMSRDVRPDESVSVVSAPSTAHHTTPRAHEDVDEQASTSSSRLRRINNPSPSINPFAKYIEMRSESVFKSNSATAPQGYVNKGSVWGVAMASLLTAAMRYYISKKDARMLMIDQPNMMAVYHKIVPLLYE
ncbi:hypothetical protein N7493_006668 [Penicillium malachiteum]|uniref:Uncharacterized protein n=1 Tax=Penicillium malachiteum TaxID=1324776 RepID=A0AAD6HLV8_9EURO|nr:hypothetical protein N7493_006668 [Penicillium malachiteum]